MLKNIIGTIGTRILNALLTLIIVFLNANYIGAEGVGTIGIIIFDITIIQLFTGFIGGGALIYFTPRTGVYRLIIPAYLWSVAVTFLIAGILELTSFFFPGTETIPEGYFWEVVTLSLLLSLSSVHFILLVGLERVGQFNRISLVQVSLLFLLVLLAYLVADRRDVYTYLAAMFFSYLVAGIWSLALLLRHITPVPLGNLVKLFSGLFRYGSMVQFANIFQLLNYRLGLYIVDTFWGRSAVGVLYTGQQVSEGLWLISRSVAMVQFARISNEDDQAYAVRITLTLAKVTWVITLLAIIFLLLIPSAFFSLLFGVEFTGIKPVIVSLAVGVVVFSVSVILSQFFSGMNKPYHNTISSAIGIVFTIGVGWLLIPSAGLIGAGIAASVSYTASTVYQFVVFMRNARLPFRSILITAGDLKIFYGMIRQASRQKPTAP